MWWRLSTVEAVNRGAEANNMIAKPIASRDEDITGLEIPTGQPIVYEFDGMQVSGERYYLKDA